MKPKCKCPKCGKALSRLQYEQIKLTDSDGKLVTIGFALICPQKSCHTIISASYESMTEIDKTLFVSEKAARTAEDTAQKIAKISDSIYKIERRLRK